MSPGTKVVGDDAAVGAGPPVRRSGPRTRRAREEQRLGLWFIGPSVVLVVVLVLAPIVWTITLAFQRLRLIELARGGPVGPPTLDNLAAVFGSPGFASAMAATLTYSIAGTAGAIGFGLVAALALRRPFRGRGLVRGMALLPYVAPVVATTFVWTTMLDPQFGIVNHWGTRWLGWAEPVAFLTQRSAEVSLFGLPVAVPTALLTVTAFEAWRSFPFAFLFLTARLQAVPATLEEAARCDGATPTQRFRYVLLPQLLPTMATLAVLRFIWTFTSFDDIYLLTGGGAGTEVIAVRVFEFLTARGDIGAAAAQAVVLAVVLAVLVGIWLRRTRRVTEVPA